MKAELKDLFAMADVVISRAGANSICELLALKKPNLLIPLSANSSRGDQILNARSFESQGFSMVIDDDTLTPELLAEKAIELYFTRQTYIDAMGRSNQFGSIKTIMKLIEELTAEKYPRRYIGPLPGKGVMILQNTGICFTIITTGYESIRKIR